jgi:serine-type D-Ala-D-Ala carboxypeptidase (penicillin-binding protein 5/6)
MFNPKNKKIILTLLFILCSFLIFFLISNKNKEVSEANIQEIIPESAKQFNKQTASKIMPKFDLILESDIVLVGNLKTGHIVFQKNADKTTNTASIVKLLSASIVLNQLKPEDVILVNDTIYTNLPSKTDLVLDEKIKVIDLLKMALIMSSNDSISALANHICYYDFLKQMNEKAIAIGMYNSHFDNPVGFDSAGNYTTALDLFQLGKYVYNNFPLIGEITKMKAVSFRSNSNIEHLVVPTNTIVDKLENY